MNKPKMSEHPMYLLLRHGDVAEFNRRKSAGEAIDLVGCDLSRLDLRELDASGLDLRDCYFRSSDLRGIDLRTTNLEGASFAQAFVSGCYLPQELSATEMQLALQHGTRVRYHT